MSCSVCGLRSRKPYFHGVVPCRGRGALVTTCDEFCARALAAALYGGTHDAVLLALAARIHEEAWRELT